MKLDTRVFNCSTEQHHIVGEHCIIGALGKVHSVHRVALFPHQSEQYSLSNF